MTFSSFFHLTNMMPFLSFKEKRPLYSYIKTFHILLKIELYLFQKKLLDSHFKTILEHEVCCSSCNIHRAVLSNLEFLSCIFAVDLVGLVM